MNKMRKYALLGLALLSGALGVKPACAVSPAGDVVGKVSVGYQGWFACVGDGAPINQWWHYSSNGQQPNNSISVIHAWPDMREFTNQYQTGYAALGNGQPAKLFSSVDQQVVNTHFSWMHQYGIDTAALQRFNPTGGEGPSRNLVTGMVKSAAEANNVKFYIMYDVSGWGSTFETDLENDWTNVMKGTYHVDTSTAYAKQNGKPVVCIWGFGFNDGNHPTDPNACLRVINWFKNAGCYVIGGVPTHWLGGTGDSYSNFLPVYHAFNMISPWMVGRIGNNGDSDNYKNSTNIADVTDCNNNGIDYQPCVLPGDTGQRAHGDFMWHQFYNMISIGSAGIYISMFDEFNEGNQIAKTAEDSSMSPAGGTWVLNQNGTITNVPFFTLDQDGTHCSSDYYLRLTGDGGKMLKGQIGLTSTRPTQPVVTSGTEGPFGGTPAAIPGTVQAENYDTGGEGVGYHDSDTLNSGGQLRTEGVDVETTSDTGGGYDVGWNNVGEWQRYTVNVSTAGTYTVTFRVANGNTTNGSFHVQNSGGTNLSGAVTVAPTGGWQTWANVTANVTLPAGQQVLTVWDDGSNYNLNYMTFAAQQSVPPAPTNLTATAGNAQVSLSWSPSSGATSYSLYRSTAAGGEGTTAVATNITSPYNNTGLTNGTKYWFTVRAINAAGSSAPSNEASATPVAAGEGPFGGTAAAIPGTVQSENYDTGGEGVAYHDAEVANQGGQYRTTDGVDVETTSDAGGGYDIGWNNTGEWQRYTVNVSTAGAYTVTFRVANGTTANGTFHLQNAGGTNLSGTVTVTPSGGWQTWKNVTANVTLPAGQQILQLSDDGGNYNINFMTFASAGGTAPPAPTNLTATAGNAQVGLTWTGSTGATSYTVLRGTATGQETTTVTSGLTGTSYTNTGLTNGTKYFYTVKAVNANGTSGASNEASATPAGGVAGIDLIVTSVSWSPASPTSGSHVVFSAVVKNQGSVATPAGTIVGVQFAVDGVTSPITWSDTDTTSLAAGASVTLTANSGTTGNFWTAASGSHTVQAWVDDVNRIGESNENNNKTTATVSVP